MNSIPSLVLWAGVLLGIVIPMITVFPELVILVLLAVLYIAFLLGKAPIAGAMESHDCETLRIIGVGSRI